MSRLAYTDLPVYLHHLSFLFSSVPSCAGPLSAPSYILILSCTIRSSGGVPARTCSACLGTVRYVFHIRIANFLWKRFTIVLYFLCPRSLSRPVLHIEAFSRLPYKAGFCCSTPVHLYFLGCLAYCYHISPLSILHCHHFLSPLRLS